jgi:uncharacterized protein GlcG (DUF336 family)
MTQPTESNAPRSRRLWLRRIASRPLFKVAMAVLSVLCAAPSDCGGGGGGSLFSNSYTVPNQANAAVSLTADLLSLNPAPPLPGKAYILAQAGNEALARGLTHVTIAVVDRVGNVLAVARIGPAQNVTVTSNSGTVGGLEGASVPAEYAAISKAITGAYLSSGGNAFSTRTANQIIQKHFPLGIQGMPGGPLFGVQFSQLPCGDFARPGSTAVATAGPHRAPLGLAADPGGMPLYMNGVLVGGIGVVSGTTYSLNPSLNDGDNNDEAVALAGAAGYEAPQQIQAQNISVNGVNLDYVGPSTVHTVSEAPVAGLALVAVPGFYIPANAADVHAGKSYGTDDSGVAPDSSLPVDPVNKQSYPGHDFYIFTTPGDPTTNFHPPQDGVAQAGNVQIKADEARRLVTSMLTIAEAARGGIRIPSNTHAQVTVSVVDLEGNILAMARTPDAPMFGADVSLQKARSSVYLSRGDASSLFNEVKGLTGASSPDGTFAYYTNAVSVNAPALFSSGTAFSEVAVGNLARPLLPDGQDNEGPGPLSLPGGRWSPFSTGLQTDLIANDIVIFLGNPGAAVFPKGCAGTANGGFAALPANSNGITQIANGLQIFSGGYPVYRGGTLVGGIGVSGDGIQQDALIAYQGLRGDPAVGAQGAPGLQHAPANIRADNPARVSLQPQVGNTSFTPLYVVCPPAPYLTSDEQTPCQ